MIVATLQVQYSFQKSAIVYCSIVLLAISFCIVANIHTVRHDVIGRIYLPYSQDFQKIAPQNKLWGGLMHHPSNFMNAAPKCT